MTAAQHREIAAQLAVSVSHAVNEADKALIVAALTEHTEAANKLEQQA